MLKFQNSALEARWLRDFLEYLFPLLFPNQTSYPSSTSRNGKLNFSSIWHTHTSEFIKSPWWRYTTGLCLTLRRKFDPIAEYDSPFWRHRRWRHSRYPSLVWRTCSSDSYPNAAHMSVKFVQAWRVRVNVFGSGLDRQVCQMLDISRNDTMWHTLRFSVGTIEWPGRGGGVSEIEWKLRRAGTSGTVLTRHSLD